MPAFHLRRSFPGLLVVMAGCAFLVSPGWAQTAAPAKPASTESKPAVPDADATPADYDNWVTLGVGGTFVNGDKGQFKHEKDVTNGAFGGVEDFHAETPVWKDGTLMLDGHALFANHDYAVKLDLTNPNVGFLRAGYTEFRTWYDGTGGFYPPEALSFAPNADHLYIDRQCAWVETGLTVPDLPAVTLRYEYDSRKGRMDSTEWGPSTAPTLTVPSFLGIDETRNIFQGDVKGTLGETDALLSLRYETDRTSDSTNFNNFPGQSFQSYLTENTLERNNIFNVHASTVTHFSPKVVFSVGSSFTTIDTNLSGSRIYGPSYNSVYSPAYPNNGGGFIDLSGGGNTKEYIANTSLMLTPVKNLAIVTALKVQDQESDVSDGYAFTPSSFPGAADASNYYLDVAESLEVRYTGFRDWSLYALGEWSEDNGNMTWDEGPSLTPSRNQDWYRLAQKYTAGANWYPLFQVNFGGQYYHQEHQYHYDNLLTDTPTTYPGYFQKRTLTTDDFNLRATWLILGNLSLITRYDFQYSTVDTSSIPNDGVNTAQVESSTLTNHILSETANWSPLPCLSLQVGGSYVINELDTPIAASTGVNNLVLNGMNDYWTIDASAGYEFNAKTHLQLQYSYYNADNYFNNAPASQPYGAGDVENSFTATVTRQVSKAVSVSLKYGFYRNRDETSGGQNNYDAQLVYLSTKFGF